MQSTIKSTLTLLISLDQATRAGARVKGDMDRSTTLDPQTNICGQRCPLSSFSALTQGWGDRRTVVWRKDKIVDGSLSTLGCGFTALKVSLINQKMEDKDKKDKDARLACEHRSMTSSTTELLDFIHTKPGKNSKETELESTVQFTLNNYACVLFHWKHTRTNRQGLPNTAPSAREQTVLMGLMS